MVLCLKGKEGVESFQNPAYIQYVAKFACILTEVFIQVFLVPFVTLSLGSVH